MKKTVLYLLFIFSISSSINAQIDAGNLLGLPAATDLAEITGIVGPQIGALVYNLDDDQVYRFTSTGWQGVLGTDDQDASEVDSDTPVDVDGDGATDDTVEDVIQAIAPITSKAGRVFYPPSIEIDASAISSSDETINLYQQYTNQYDLTDASVFNIISLSDAGILTYRIIGTPTSANTLINVVFVVK